MHNLTKSASDSALPCIRTALFVPELDAERAQMADALQHLHARAIAHLDVKPDNIYTTPAGAFKLGDFGLATPRGGGAVAECTLSPDEGDSRCVRCPYSSFLMPA